MRTSLQAERVLGHLHVAERCPRMRGCARDFTVAEVPRRRPTMLRRLFQFVRGRFIEAGCFFESVGTHGARSNTTRRQTASRGARFCPERAATTLTVSRIDIYRYRYILFGMARAATTADAFDAGCRARRRQILDVLAGGERPVGDLVHELGMGQPQVSKHLRVLREVGAVDVREHGRQRLYRLNGRALKPIHDWVQAYEQTWSERFDQLDVVLEELKKEEGDGGGK